MIGVPKNRTEKMNAMVNKGPHWLRTWNQAGMTLVEVLMALAISGLGIGSIVAGYVFAVRSAETSALSLAANAAAMRRVEEARCARWVISAWPVIDQLVATNFSNTVVKLDVSGTSSGITWATNFTSVSQISTNPYLKQIRVDCVWAFKGSKLFTNTVETCRAPDQ